MIKKSHAQETPPSSLAWLISATVGQSFSGGIAQAAKLLRPSLRAIPRSTYSFITQAIIFVNIASWVAVYIKGVDNTLSTKKPSPEDKFNDTIDGMEGLIKTAFPNDDVATIKIALRKKLQEYLGRQAELAAQRDELKKEARNNPSILRRILSYVPGIEAYKRFTANDRATVISDLVGYNTTQLADSDHISSEKDYEKLASICNRHVERLLPSQPIGSFSELLNRLSYYIATACVHGYAFISNNIGFMVMGGLGMLSMLHITNPIASYLTLAWFFGVGSLSALSFSKPGALSGYHQIFGYSKEEAAYLSKLRPNSHRAGLFKLPLWAQVPLAISLASSIAILNFAANVALGQVIFAGKSLFSPVLFTQALFSPMTAAYPSLILGAFGGITALVTLSLMLTGAVMQIHPKATEKKAASDSKQASKLTLLTTGLALTAVACKVAMPASIITTLTSTLFMSSIMFTLNYNEKDTLSANVAAAVNIGISTFITYYFNVPLLKLALPTKAAQGIAAVFAFANAELTPPVLNRQTINDWQNNATKSLGMDTKVKVE